MQGECFDASLVEALLAFRDSARQLLRVQSLALVLCRQHPGGPFGLGLQTAQLLHRPVTKGQHVPTTALGVGVRDRPGLCLEIDVGPAGEGELAASLSGEQQERDDMRKAVKARRVLRILAECLEFHVREHTLAWLFLAARQKQKLNGRRDNDAAMNTEFEKLPEEGGRSIRRDRRTAVGDLVEELNDFRRRDRAGITTAPFRKYVLGQQCFGVAGIFAVRAQISLNEFTDQVVDRMPAALDRDRGRARQRTRHLTAFWARSPGINPLVDPLAQLEGTLASLRERHTPGGVRVSLTENDAHRLVTPPVSQ